MSRNDIDDFRDRLNQKLEGRNYVFVVMAYGSRYSVFEKIQRAVADELGYACIRADNMMTMGQLLLPQIQLLIDQAQLVVAEISENNPNVFYELGYADAIGKPILPLIQRNSEMDLNPPSNLMGHLVLRYMDDGSGTFDRDLRKDLASRGNPRLKLLREFLLAARPEPAYIVASPKFPKPERAPISQRQQPDVRTFSDNLGILGLIRAFGATLGEAAEVHLVSAQWSPDELYERDYNFYLIGSHKVNPRAKGVLQEIQQGCKSEWIFAPLPEHTEEGDWQVALYRPGESKPLEALLDQDGRFITEDYGLIVRAPWRKDRVRMVIAGSHSLGTAAACYAATTPAVIERIKKKLPSGTLEDKTARFWVLVKGKEDPKDHLLNRDEAELEIEAGLLT